MTALLRKWKIEGKFARFEFALDAPAHKALIELFDLPISPVERQAGMLEILRSHSEKPPRAAALSAHVEQILTETAE